ncbi:hypothetical protein Bbelb_443760 [Branchiostoma belcheri]|nr:hypothetical protein Bbelb_443760 [Branchiostoma belcheri]
MVHMYLWIERLALKWETGFDSGSEHRGMSEHAHQRCALGKDTLHASPPQIEGQVSNSSCLQLVDESSARRAGVVKADLERNQIIRHLAARIPTGTSTSPSISIHWGRRMPKVCGIRNL